MNLKNIVLYILFFVCVNLIIVTQVNADNVSELPKDYTSGEYTYSINSIELNIYSASDKDYLQTDLIKKISLLSDYSIDIEEQDHIFNNIQGKFIKLNLSLTKENIVSFLKESNINDRGSLYYFEIVLNYTIKNIPSNYMYLKNINLLDSVLANSNNKYSKFKEFNLNQNTTQIINIGTIKINNDNYTVNMGNEIYNDILLAKFIDYSLISNIQDIEQINNENSHIIMFHDLNNIESIINSYDSIYDKIDKKYNNKETKKESNKKESEKIMDEKLILIIIGIILVIIGIVLSIINVRYTKLEKNIKH